MTHPDMTELRELRERLQGAEADKRELAVQLAAARAALVESDRQREEIRYHRDRLLDEKRLILEAVYDEPRPSVASEIPTEPERDPDQLPLLEERRELEC
jgi:hypothetical protein